MSTSIISHTLNTDTPKNRLKFPPILAKRLTQSICGDSVEISYDLRII